MIKWALVQNDKIEEIHDKLPSSWDNISNFFVIDDLEYLKSLGWYSFEEERPEYDNVTQTLSVNYSFIDGAVVVDCTITDNLSPDLPPNEYDLQWEIIRKQRDQLMKDFEWRYTRLSRQQRMLLPETDSLILLDKYMQDLANITNQPNPFNITWPVYNQSV